MKSGFASEPSSLGGAYASYGIQLQNVSPDEDALSVEVVVNLLDASGLILKSDSSTYEGIPAGATYYAGGVESTPTGTPSRLEITVKVGGRQKKSIPGLPAVSNVRVVDYFGPEVFGEIQNTYTKTLSSLALITFVCFDAAGNIIGGGYTFPQTALSPGARVAFNTSVSGGLSVSQIASVQVSVEPELE